MPPQAYEPRRPPAPPVDPRRRAVPRDGSSLLETLLRERVERFVAALPAKDVIELLLLPRNRAGLARQAGYRSPAVAYNALRPLSAVVGAAGTRHHPQRPFRKRYARELGCALSDLEHLVDTPAAPLPGADGADDGAADDGAADDGADTAAAAPMRDGTGVLERRVVEKVGAQARHLTASAVVRYLLWPQTPTHWAAGSGFTDSALFNCLCWTNLMEYRPIRRALSATLAARFAEDAAVVERALDVLIESPPAPWPARPKRGRGRAADADQGSLALADGDSSG